MLIKKILGLFLATMAALCLAACESPRADQGVDNGNDQSSETDDQGRLDDDNPQNGNAAGDDELLGIGKLPTSPPSYIGFIWDEQTDNAEEWAGYVYVALEYVGQDLIKGPVPTDIADFCPNYRALNDVGRNMFWISLVAAMTKYLSDFDPDKTQVSSGPLGTIMKRGLMQIDHERALSHSCATPDKDDLYDPERNLNCAVKIINDLVARDGAIRKIPDNSSTPWGGAAEAWTILRQGSELEEIQRITSEAFVCK